MGGLSKRLVDKSHNYGHNTTATPLNNAQPWRLFFTLLFTVLLIFVEIITGQSSGQKFLWFMFKNK